LGRGSSGAMQIQKEVMYLVLILHGQGGGYFTLTYLHFTLDIANSIYVAVLFSLTAIKGIALVFDYGTFQKMVARMLQRDKGRGVVLVDIGASFIGLVILVVTFMVY